MEIYTDGSYSRKHSIGGWSVVVFIDDDNAYFYSGKQRYSSSNCMEIYGVLQALNYVYMEDITDNVTIYCDSKYVVNGATKWCKKWDKCDWRVKNGDEVKHKNLWKQILDFTSVLPNVSICWVKARSNNRGNDLADKFAKRHKETFWTKVNL